jgi:hypothetical protein
MMLPITTKPDRARIVCGAASLLPGGLLKNSFPVVARRVASVATAKITGYWRKPFHVKFGQRHGHARDRAAFFALEESRRRGVAFNFFSFT